MSMFWEFRDAQASGLEPIPCFKLRLMAVSHNPTTEVFPHDDGWGYRVHCSGCDKIAADFRNSPRAINENPQLMDR